jgi:SH3-like domain-containing protein
MQRVLGHPLRYYGYRLGPLAGVLLLIIAIVPADLTATANAVSSIPTKLKSSLAPTVVAGPTAPVDTAAQSPQLPQKQSVTTASIDRAPVAHWAPAGAWSTPPLVTQASVTPAGARRERVGASGVNLRAAPSKDAARLDTLAPGAEVQVAEAIDGWLHVYAAGREGWIYSSYLEGAQVKTAAATAGDAPSRNVAGNTIRVRSAVPVQDSPDGDAIYSLEPGERVSVAEQRGSWLRIITSDGESGWIRVR